MFVETLSTTVTDDGDLFIVIELGDRLQISDKRLAYLIKKHYKDDKKYTGYQITGDTQFQELEIKELKKLLNWKEIKEKILY